MWVGKIPWRRAWQPTPVFLPGESPWTEESGRLQSIRSHRVRHNSSDLACTWVCVCVSFSLCVCLSFYLANTHKHTHCCSFSRSVVSDTLQLHGLQHFQVLHYLPEFAQTHVLWVDDAIQPPHLLSHTQAYVLSYTQTPLCTQTFSLSVLHTHTHTYHHHHHAQKC